MRSFMLVVACCAVSLAAATPALGAQAPLDGQVNNDNSAGVGIDPAKDAGVSDVVGGALTAGALEIPWATFEQKTTGAQNIFVRAFKNGAWVTEGFPASLNIDTSKEAEAPSIDFAGAGRTVPWVSWYEPNANFVGPPPPTQIFASRFASNPASTGGGQWVAEGQDRAAPNRAPSLNIHVTRTAENPAVSGGATTAGADPVPWIAWEENDGTATDNDAHRQIFVSNGVKQASTGATCTGFKPAATATTGVFCWQQVGSDRLSPTATTSSSSGDPSVNVDPTRAGVEPDMAFTGPSDIVPWVVWYEKGTSTLGGFRNPGVDQIFAAKAVGDGAADGKFHWQAVGARTAGQTNPLDTSATNGFGPCAQSQAADDACSLNKVATHGAENPRVASGSLAPGAATVPWVVWEEDGGGGAHQIFLAHLVGGDHFELFNGGAPLSNTLNDATRPDIAFSNHEPYVSWHETIGGVDKLFLAHFEGGAAAPTFHLDTPDGIASSAFGNVPDLRAPISSTCTATPFSSDGTSCRGGALGTPFTLFADGAAGSQKLFGQAYAPSDVGTGDASSVTTTSATVAGAVNPGGAPVRSGFDFGPTGAFGSSASGGVLGASTSGQPFQASLSGLPSATTISYRATASSDFTTITGATRTFTTATVPPPPPPPTNAAPTSKITGLASKVKAAKLKRIQGTAADADDGVAKVEVAITRATGGAHAAAAKCLRLTSRGTFKTTKAVKKRCTPAFLKASGTSKWKFTLKKRLPKGKYEVYSRATDVSGQKQSGFNSANRRSLKVV
ncbi:MAG: hypothetical protein QOJ07_1218 [Thermoleophilaceae bacterium]|nr:hypothetical protein [Thermoleophilaceae bacterium]